MNKLSSQDRASLIRLAASLPKGSEERRTLLAAFLRMAGVSLPPSYREVLKSLYPEGPHKMYGPKVSDIKDLLGVMGKLLPDPYSVTLNTYRTGSSLSFTFSDGTKFSLSTTKVSDAIYVDSGLTSKQFPLSAQGLRAAASLVSDLSSK